MRFPILGILLASALSPSAQAVHLLPGSTVSTRVVPPIYQVSTKVRMRSQGREKVFAPIVRVRSKEEATLSVRDEENFPQFSLSISPRQAEEGKVELSIDFNQGEFSERKKVPEGKVSSFKISRVSGEEIELYVHPSSVP